MIKEQIPWRSLLAIEDVKKIKDTYLVFGVPHSILIDPYNNIEVINLLKKIDLEKLYNTVTNNYNN